MPIRVESWSKPVSGEMKFNVDGAVGIQRGIRDKNGHPKVLFLKSIDTKDLI